MNLKHSCFLYLLLGIGVLFLPGYSVAQPELKSAGGLTFSLPTDDRYWFTVGGRLFLDETLFWGKAQDKQTDFPSGGDVRLAYLNLKGGVGHDWSYALTLSFKGQISVEREAYLNYSGFQNTNIQIGQIGIPSSLENWSDYSDLMFLETSLLSNVFFPEDDYGLGIHANRTFLDLFTLAGAVYQPRQQETTNFGDSGRADRLAEAVRLTFSPVHTDHRVYHLGAWLRHQALVERMAGVPVSPTLAFQGFSGPPEAQARNTASLVNTGPFGAKSYELAGIEAAVLKGPVTIQSEYLLANVHRMYLANDPAVFEKCARFYAWYVQGGYVLTGESRGYDFNGGTFSRVTPTKEWGALEIALRYSAVSLVHGKMNGGVEHNVSIGLNWFLNEQVRVATNYIRAIIHPTTAPAIEVSQPTKHRLNIIAARLQVAF